MYVKSLMQNREMIKIIFSIENGKLNHYFIYIYKVKIDAMKMVTEFQKILSIKMHIIDIECEHSLPEKH